MHCVVDYFHDEPVVPWGDSVGKSHYMLSLKIRACYILSNCLSSVLSNQIVGLSFGNIHIMRSSG